MDLSKKIFGSNIDPEIQEYFKNLQKGTFDIQPGDPLSDTSFDSSTQTYLGDRTPYARMWTAVNVVSVQKDPDNPSKFKPIGNGKNSVYIVNDNSFNSYESSELDPIMQEYYGAPSELGYNPLLKPAAGVTEVTSRAEGSLGALRRTVVKFVVHNKEDFDKTFLPFFLKPGSHVFVDFGWSDKAFSLYDPNDFINNTDLEMTNFVDTIYNDDDKIKSGFTTTVSGQVTKYDVNINQNQSFECTLEFVSANYQLLDKEVSEDNNLKFIFTNVLEDLILLKFMSNQKNGSKLVREELSMKHLWEEISREQRAENIKKYFDENSDFNKDNPLIDDYSKIVGIYYQNFESDNTSVVNQKESLYISFAVFEDDFLNNYVATTVKKDKEGNIISETVDKTSNMPKFNSRNTYIRWDQDLFEMMKIKPNSNDKILSFLYPDTWDENTSNKSKPTIITERGKENEWKNTSDDKLKRRIPLRELFISTTMIIEAFEASSNINDALERIFDNIFEDSGNLINIRVMKNNDFESSLTFHDVNIEPIEKKSDETFKFDITGGNTIVQNVDLKFETPKAGLSSMIAIGGLSTPDIFDDFQLMRFNILNAIQSDGKKKQIRHLPIFGELITTERVFDVDVSKILKGNPSAKKLVDSARYNKEIPNPVVNSIDPSDLSVKDWWYSTGAFAGKLIGGYGDFKKRRAEQLKQLKKEKLNKPREYRQIKQKDDDRPIFTANSKRDVQLIKAKVQNFIKTDANSISPVLPISLTLEIYGNNFLNIGDYFTINFLPEHFKDRVYFQIVGVDHNVSTSNWKTTYNTVMRPYSNKKYHQFGSTASDDLASYVKVKFNGVVQEDIQKQFSKGSENLNPYAQYILELFDLTGQQTLNFKIKDENDSCYVTSYKAQYDIFKIDEEKSSQDQQDQSGVKFSDERRRVIITSGDTDSYKSEKQIAWSIEISKLLLGDDVINWKLWSDQIKDSFRPQLFAVNQGGRDAYKWEDAQAGSVFVGPRLYNNKTGKFYSKILGKVDDFYKAFFTLGEAGGYDPIQKIVDDFILQEGKTQKISDVLNISDWNGDGFHFLHSIHWPLKQVIYDENTLTNQFKIIHFENNNAINSFSLIQIPSEYMIMSPNDFYKKLWKNYTITYGNLMKKIGEIERVASESIEEAAQRLGIDIDKLII